MNEKLKFENPYNDLPKEDRYDYPIVVGRQDYTLLRAILPRQGTIMIVATTLISKLCNELRKLNITDASSGDQLKSFICGCRIVSAEDFESLTLDAAQWQQHLAAGGRGGFSNRPVEGTVQNPVGRNVRRGAKSKNGGSAADAAVVADVQSRDGVVREGEATDQGGKGGEEGKL